MVEKYLEPLLLADLLHLVHRTLERCETRTQDTTRNDDSREHSWTEQTNGAGCELSAANEAAPPPKSLASAAGC
jgi:hypothetical protein